MSDWTSAVVYAIRTLRRQPTFTLIALLTLTLGIGANTAIFSVIKTVVLNPLPYDDPDRIAVVWEVNPDGAQERVSVPTFDDWKAKATSFESMAAFRQVDFSHKGTGDPRNVRGVRATTDLFRVLKADAFLGRTFVPEESVVGADRVVVSATDSGRACSVADREPRRQDDSARCRSVHRRRRHAAWLRVSHRRERRSVDAARIRSQGLHGQSRRARSLLVVARVTAGASIAQAQQELSVLAGRIANEFKSSNEGWGAGFSPPRSNWSRHHARRCWC